MIVVLKMASALIASMILGNWFITEVKKSKINNDPWYKPYFSPPGLLIISAMTILIIFGAIKS